MTRIPFGRRAFLALSSSCLLFSGKSNGQKAGGQAPRNQEFFQPQHFLDPATELDLYRITDPNHTSYLSAAHLRFISRRGRFLVHSSDRSGSLQIYRLDWHTGESRLLTAATALDPATPALSLDDRSLVYCDGQLVKQATLNAGKERTLVEVGSGWQRSPGFSLSADGTLAVWVEDQGEQSRLRAMHTVHGTPATVLTVTGRIGDPLLRPGHSQVVYRLGSALYLVNVDGSSQQAINTDTGGSPGQALWTRDGSALLYLSVPEDRKRLTTLREYTPGPDGGDKLIAKTSQFACFGVNGDASVFVGASRSLASPYILLLVRAARRELTLCEHRASDANAVSPVFSPDSQSIFFTSDRKGKPAIYRVHVERFVEETGEEAGV